MIIVTGGAGFIGSNLVYSVNQKGINDILIIDNLSNAAKHLNLNSLEFSDFIDKSDLNEYLPKLGQIEAIFHQGACSSTTENDGKYMMKNNFEASKTLLDFALARKIDFYYASSASVYGNGSIGFSADSNNYWPLNVYAFSKLLFDKYVSRILESKKNKSKIVGLRYFNVYGYQENHKGNMSSVPFKFFQQSSKGIIELFEGSDQFLRDFIFVEDVIDVILHFYDNHKSGIFNCGTGKPRSFQDIANIYAKLVPQLRIDYVPFPEMLVGKYQTFTKADVSCLEKSGYDCNRFTTLEDGVHKYYNKLKQTNGYLWNL